MFGAMLLSAPAGARNRNLFRDLVFANINNLTDDLQLLLMATTAMDDNSRRMKNGSTCARLSLVLQQSLDPYPGEVVRNQVPPDPYDIAITDDPVLMFNRVAPDVLAYGGFDMYSMPEHGLGLYRSLDGHAYQGTTQVNQIPNDVLTLLLNDTDPTANFVTKAKRDVLDQVHGRYVAQIISAGADPFLMLMRKERAIHLHFVERSGCFYLVWSDFELIIDSTLQGQHRPYVWPLLTFAQGDQNLTGFSMKMLRNRWVRWLTPKVTPTRIKDVDMMRVPRAIAALQQWLLRHTL